VEGTATSLNQPTLAAEKISLIQIIHPLPESVTVATFSGQRCKSWPRQRFPSI
jgi:hypothetical protein